MLFILVAYSLPLLGKMGTAILEKTTSLSTLQKLDNSLKKVPYIEPILVGAGLVGIGYWGLKTTPISNRKKFVFLPNFIERLVGSILYKIIFQFVSSKLLPTEDPDYQRISAIVDRLLSANKDRLPSLSFTLHVIDQNAHNVFVLPNGKMFVYKGLLKVAATDAQISAVLAHSIGHVLARHFGEKITFATILSFAFKRFLNKQTEGSDIMGGATRGLINLKYSRALEYEADVIGLHLMTKACYNPNGALEVWENFKKVPRLSKIEFLCTHPSYSDRIQYLKTKMGEIQGWEQC